MVSRRTLEQIMRAHDRREQQLLQTIADLTDRLMFMVGRTWTPPPADLEPPPETWSLEEDTDEFVTDAEQVVD